MSKGALKSDIFDNEILFRKSFVFVLETIKYIELLEKADKKLFAKKLLKLVTTFGEGINNIRHITYRKSFIFKLKNSEKEALKIKYLLQLCKYSENFPNSSNLIIELDKIIDFISTVLLAK